MTNKATASPRTALHEGDMNKEVMESVCHQKGTSRAVELWFKDPHHAPPPPPPLPEEQYVLICCICFLTMCQNCEGLIELPGAF